MIRRLAHELIRATMYRAAYLAGLLCLLVAAAALADSTAQSPEPSLFARLFTPEALVGAAVTLIGGIFGGAKWLSARRKKLIALATYHAFHMTEDACNETEGEDVFDKVKFALMKADEYMVANGWRPLKPGEVTRAKLGFQALHGEQIAAAKVIAKAGELAQEQLTDAATKALEAAPVLSSPR